MRNRLLLVDDDAAIRGLISLELQRTGFEVTTVPSIEEASRMLDNTQFSLVITDLLLSEGDGLEVVEAVKHRHPCLPVVILTGVGFDDAAMSEALARGADGYVSKGLTMSHLRMEIDRVLRKGAVPFDSAGRLTSAP